ncbi:hypothetical protein SmJEL517_g04078 [Synchytrium microbalum]|uniref:RING-type domain-containing protein n=1 Tax=Synchytrium microbalum TaxID=1806994 RepID=A0A507C0E5_9FUNG|nr:uncharacterized protein SmJEL517_g04078 [Synchytrium microbalum]TPX32881.1 hypothetical protein SmJEL517_g04078 [Synchytrium microbalum]
MNKKQNLVWASTALQDHLIRKPGALQSNAHAKQREKWRSERASLLQPSTKNKKRYYVDTLLSGKDRSLEFSEEPLTLAEKMNLVTRHTPSRLSESEWAGIKSRDSAGTDECSICCDIFRLSDQVLLSCAHTFHRRCLESYEHHVGRRNCPLCRSEHYEKRLVNTGRIRYVGFCAAKIQATYRMHRAHKHYLHIRATCIPKTTYMKKKYFVDKLSEAVKKLKIDDSGVDLLDGFLRDVDCAVDASRRVISSSTIQLITTPPPSGFHASQDIVLPTTSSQTWTQIIKKSEERKLLQSNCPICLSCFTSKKAACITNCGHVFHESCLQSFERFGSEGCAPSCPVCRNTYTRMTMPKQSN